MMIDLEEKIKNCEEKLWCCFNSCYYRIFLAEISRVSVESILELLSEYFSGAHSKHENIKYAEMLRHLTSFAARKQFSYEILPATSKKNPHRWIWMKNFVNIYFKVIQSLNQV